MGASDYRSIMAFILTIDRQVFAWVAAITFFLAVSVVALLARGRKWPEIICLFILIYLVAVVCAAFLFTYVVQHPFARLEVISYP